MTLSLAVGAKGATFTVTRGLGPIRASYTQVATAIDHLNTFLVKANGKSPHATISITIAKESSILAKDSSQVAFSDRVNPATAAEAVPVAHAFSYVYSCYDCAAVTNVTIDFSDFQRKIMVAGESYEHVNALAAFCVTQFVPLARGFGGLLTRGIAGVVIFAVSFTLQAAGIILSLPVIKFGRRWLTMTLSVVGLAIMLAYWIAPMNEWYPGVAIYGINPSFVTRYTAEITFWGAVASIAISIGGVILSVRMGRRRELPLVTSKRDRRK